MEDLLNPYDHLGGLAQEWGWDKYYDAGGDPEWAEGMCQRIEQKQIMHSCWCALSDHFEVRRRIWHAQLRVLYPFLEEQRLVILQRINPKHILPFEDLYGNRIYDPEDLEIGHIEHLIRTKAMNKYSHLLSRISDLKEIRNLLAHRKIVDIQRLQSKAVSEPLT